jgi:N-acetylmuramoyl-L-alanine amidase
MVDAPPVGPALVSGMTNAHGVVDLNTGTLTNGAHALSITAPQSTTDPVGPNVEGAVPPPRMFRPLQVSIRTVAGRVDSVNVPPLQQANGTATLGGNPRVVVELQPVWIRSPNHGTRGTPISTIIVHHTGGPTIGPALNTFLNAQVSAHYVIDTDGQVVKMVQDSRRSSHAGTASWRGSTQVNSSSIGIEIVNADGQAYQQAQYASLLDLVDRLVAAHPTIEAWNIVGHSDVGTSASGQLGRKSTDPGNQFEWSRLEARNFGLVPAVGPVPSTIYGGFFALVPSGAFRREDSDATSRFGGAHRPAVTGLPVEEIQQDLTDIGYSVGTPDGDFGAITEAAVEIFQEHFFAGGRGGAPNGRVDLATAEWIKRVVANCP